MTTVDTLAQFHVKEIDSTQPLRKGLDQLNDAETYFILKHIFAVRVAVVTLEIKNNLKDLSRNRFFISCSKN